MSTQPVLQVRNLRVSYPNREGVYSEVVKGLTFALGHERLGIVGESGSGKSQTGRAILGLSAAGARVSADCLEFKGTNLLHCSALERRKLRGGQIAMVLQDPKFSLNPVMTIGAQIVESLRAHTPVGEQAMALLEALRRGFELRVVSLAVPQRKPGEIALGEQPLTQ